jgi:hypothetical protein
LGEFKRGIRRKNMPAKKMLIIEWKHLDVEGETCERCSGTIREIRRAVEDLKQEGKLDGITVRIRETPLSAERIQESNAILINGTPIENILAGTVQGTSCPSCSALTGQSTCCRALTIEGVEYEEVQAAEIRRAIEIDLQRG